jgi:MFS family permease
LFLKKIPRQVIILGLVSLFTDIASEMLYPVTPIFLTAVLGASMAIVGLIEGIAEFTAGILKGYFGRLSDKIGRRSIFVTIGYSLSAISKPIPGIFPFIPSVVFSRITDRIGKGIRTAPRDALLASYAEGNTGAIFGFHRGMDTLGAAIGPITALILLHFYPNNYRLIFLVAFLPSIIAVGFTTVVKEKATSAVKKKKENFSVLWKNSPKKFKEVIIFITLFSFVNSSDVFLILKSQNISRSSTLAILGYIFYNLVYALTSYPIGKISDRFSKKSVFISGLIIFSLVYFGFAVTQNLNVIWGLFVLYGIYAASTEGIAKAWISDLIPDQNRGTAIGLLTMLSGIAMMTGSVITGILWDQFGSMIPFIISSIVSILIAMILMILV